MWYATRGSGVVSLVLLSAIVGLGVAGVRRLGSERWPRFLVVGLHRNLTLLALVFLALHIATTVLDGFAPIKLRDAVIPFGSAYRPVWLGLGAVAFDLLLALTITSLLRARFGYRTWRALHWMAYAAWPVALVHALGTGSDGGVRWLQLLALGLTATVGAAVIARLADSSTSFAARLGGGVALLLIPLGMLLWYATGPGKSGWAARSGTPASLLPHRVLAPAPVALPPAPVADALPAAPYTAALRGRLSSTQGADGLVLVSIRGTTRAPAKGVLWIRLQGRPIDGGVAMSSSGASYGPLSEPDQYRGTIVSLRGTRIVLALHGQPGALALRVDLRIDGVSHRVTGTVAAARTGGGTS
jgi:sulfoxide reductase heme-binding subunit YedZ